MIYLAEKIFNQEVSLNSFDSLGAILTGLLQLALFAVGAISVIFIIIGGIQYITSSGSPDAIKKAKSTLVFAVVGLALAISASLIINFTIGALSK